MFVDRTKQIGDRVLQNVLNRNIENSVYYTLLP